MDGVLRISHGSDVHRVCACCSDDGTDLLAVGGEHSVDVFQITPSSSKKIASFHVGTRITALAWSPRTISPSASDAWTIELAAAAVDFGLHLLTRSSASDENVFPFGGGLSGHHGRVNDMSFCGGRDRDGSRYVATVSDDKMLMVWDLQPTLDIASGITSAAAPSHRDETSSPQPRLQPTAYVISFPHPLTTVNSHPSSSKEFLVSDCHGSLFLTDWRSDPEQSEQGSWRHSSVVELVEPHTLSTSITGLSLQWTGFAAWRRDAFNIIGATYGSGFSIWDLSKIQGGKPLHSETCFPEGGYQFRWCPTNTDYFAIASHSPDKGAVIHVYNMNYVHAQPNIIHVASRPHRIRDFDFMANHSKSTLAVALGREIMVFSLGVK
ncbi:WD40-repeat-containing domain protein [Hygrophoropsis aurantiaca]|uniref:WD40-repeat-containing domain protein n=1 Tax=Hygrophoropsis aurantiaca TaxID=72124 RepID=A0ACB8A5K8_9AGAM|nr:WD40-repeat-containing domain protein [Hygrophoropsis aurantiaca]